MQANPVLLQMLRAQLDSLVAASAPEPAQKQAFVPAGGGDPAAGGAPPGMPGPGMPPPGDPAAAGGMPPPGAPPMDPAAAGGMPAPGLDPTLQQAITTAVQQAMASGGAGVPGAKKPGTGKAGGDEVARQLYNMNALLTAIVGGLNRAGMDIQLPPEMLLGPPPGSDPATAVAMSQQIAQPPAGGQPADQAAPADAGQAAAAQQPIMPQLAKQGALAQLAGILGDAEREAAPIGFAVQRPRVSSAGT